MIKVESFHKTDNMKFAVGETVLFRGAKSIILAYDESDSENLPYLVQSTLSEMNFEYYLEWLSESEGRNVHYLDGHLKINCEFANESELEKITNDPIVLKLREDAKIPTKRLQDAGYDLYAVWDKEIVIVKPHSLVMLPTGIKIMFPSNCAALFRERGSTGVINLQVRAGVVEGNFKGEYKLILSNGNDYLDIIFVTEDLSFETLIKEMDKIYPHDDWQATNPSHLKIEKDEFGRQVLKRSTGAYGMTGVDLEYLDTAYIYQQKKAVAQMLLVEKKDWEFQEVTEEEFETKNSDRGEGMLGSSGK